MHFDRRLLLLALLFGANSVSGLAIDHRLTVDTSASQYTSSSTALSSSTYRQPDGTIVALETPAARVASSDFMRTTSTRLHGFATLSPLAPRKHRRDLRQFLDGPETALGPTKGGETASGPSKGGETATGPSRGGETASGPSRGGPTASGPTKGGETATGPSRGGETATGPTRSQTLTTTSETSITLTPMTQPLPSSIFPSSLATKTFTTSTSSLRRHATHKTKTTPSTVSTSMASLSSTTSTTTTPVPPVSTNTPAPISDGGNHQPHQPKHKSPIPNSAVAGIASGIIAGAVMVALGVVYCYRRHRTGKPFFGARGSNRSQNSVYPRSAWLYDPEMSTPANRRFSWAGEDLLPTNNTSAALAVEAGMGSPGLGSPEMGLSRSSSPLLPPAITITRSESPRRSPKGSPRRSGGRWSRPMMPIDEENE